ncbi:MAG: phytase [Planctomycetaceae bacterium]
MPTHRVIASILSLARTAGFLFVGLLRLSPLSADSDAPLVLPALRLHAERSRDQDDLCLWRCEHDPPQSLIIASDKSANFLFCYTLKGELLQSIPVSRPGNVDIRQNVRLGNELRDVVVVNQREPEPRLRVFTLHRTTRQLEQVDNEIITVPNYGGCLYYDRQAAQLYFVITSKQGQIGQYELSRERDGPVQGRLVRSWAIGNCEGAVADDQSSTLFIAEEKGTVWKVGAGPTAATPGRRLTAVGDLGLKGDLEGLALLRDPRWTGPLLVVSDQGRSRFVVLTTDDEPRRLCEFSVAGAVSTDGIDALRAPLGPEYPEGVFVCHTDQDDRRPLVVDLRKILQLLPE